MNDRPDEFTPYWLQTAMPSTGNGEMPGQPVMFPWEYPWPHTAPRDMWADSTASNPLVPSPPPPWLNTASPFGADFKQPAWPDPSAPHSASKTEGRIRPSSRADAVNALSAPVMQPWEYPWPHTLPRDMWVQAMQPTPSAAPPSLFPLAHLDSGKYWPGAPPVANDQPQAPSAASWATAAPPHSALKTRVDALLAHLDSAKYWPAAPAWDGGESATAAPQPSPVTVAGLAKQGSVALAKALIGVPGMLGDARELGFGIGDWISQKILDRRTLTDQQRLEQAHGADFTPGAAARQRQQRQDEARRNLLVTNPLSALAPSSSDIQGVIEQVTGPFRQPENMPEEYVDTIGQFAPSIFGGPGGWFRRGAQWLGPALTSETAGQLTKGTEWEPAARFASTIFGGAVPYFFRPSAPRAAPPPAAAEPPPRPAVAGEVPVAAPQRVEDARERAFGAPGRAAAAEPPPHPAATADDVRVATPRAPEATMVPALQEAAPASGSVRATPTSQGRLFDYSRLHEVPPVEQRNLPRYQPPHGVPEYIQALDNPGNLDRMNEFARIGLERGGHRAFNLEELRQHYIAELGPEKGRAGFEQFTNLLAAVSPLSTDLAMLRNASYYDALIKQGRTLPVPAWDPGKGRLVLPQPLDVPYGHIRQGLHAKKVNEVVARGGLDPLSNPKLASLAEDYRGNYMPIPLDSHYTRASGATNKRGQPIDVLPRAGYGFVEQLGQREAAKMGIPPGHYQAAVRAGAAEHTGLRSLDPILATFEDRLGVTAQQLGMTKAEALRRLIRHGVPLLSLMGMAGADTTVPAQGNALEEEDS